MTGGQYYIALDQQMLVQAYRQIDALEPELYESLSFRPRRAVFHFPLAIVALLLMLSIPLYILMGVQRLKGGNE